MIGQDLSCDRKLWTDGVKNRLNCLSCYSQLTILFCQILHLTVMNINLDLVQFHMFLQKYRFVTFGHIVSIHLNLHGHLNIQ